MKPIFDGIFWGGDLYQKYREYRGGSSKNDIFAISREKMGQNQPFSKWFTPGRDFQKNGRKSIVLQRQSWWPVGRVNPDKKRQK